MEGCFSGMMVFRAPEIGTEQQYVGCCEEFDVAWGYLLFHIQPVVALEWDPRVQDIDGMSTTSPSITVMLTPSPGSPIEYVGEDINVIHESKDLSLFKTEVSGIGKTLTTMVLVHTTSLLTSSRAASSNVAS